MSTAIRRRLEYQDLLLPPEQTEFAYEVDANSFLGTSLNVNILGSKQKVCSFDCPYCYLGVSNLRINKIRKEHNFPKAIDIEEGVKHKLMGLRSGLFHINSICLSGNGEPTLHPQLNDIINSIIEVRDQWDKEMPIAILSNGATLGQRKVLDAVNKLDEAIIKLDAGTDKLLKEINAPMVRTSESKLLQGMFQLENLSIQTFFCKGTVDNTNNEDVEEWIEVVGMAKPKNVYLHTLTHVPAQRGLLPADEETLLIIASRLARRTGIKAKIFGA